MRPMMSRRAVLASALAALASRASAQQSQSLRVRGDVTAFADRVLTVKTREGDTLAIRLPDPVPVVGVARADIGDVKANSFVGVAALKGADGQWVALEVLVFPESARGSGEGHYPWDLQPRSSMTNGTVATVSEGAHGRTLKITYKGSDQPIEIMVPPSAPIVTLAPASVDLLKPGAHVFTAATKAASGEYTAARVLVGIDGLVPPM